MVEHEHCGGVVENEQGGARDPYLGSTRVARASGVMTIGALALHYEALEK